MDDKQQLIQAAQLLKTVPVTGDYWAVMIAVVNTILKVAENIGKGADNANNNKP